MCVRDGQIAALRLRRLELSVTDDLWVTWVAQGQGRQLMHMLQPAVSWARKHWLFGLELTVALELDACQASNTLVSDFRRL